MHDLVQRYWKDAIVDLRARINKSNNQTEKSRLQKRSGYMRSVRMAVIVSEEAYEAEKFARQNLNIKPHRDRMNKVDKSGQDTKRVKMGLFRLN